MKERAKKFWYEISQKKLTIPSAAVILGVTSLASNLLGVIRERLIAAQFGASHMTDVFYASFRLPDLIFNLLVLGAVSSAFIPIFVDQLNKKDKEASNKLASNFMNFLLLGTIILGVVIFVLARKLVPFLLPGFFADGAKADFNTFNTTVTAVRIMVLSPVLFALSSVFGAILNSHKRFLSYALAPLVYNLSIIIGILFFAPRTNPPVYGLLYGVLLGAFAHAMIQLPAVVKTGFRYKPILDFNKYSLPEIIKLMVPRTLAIGVSQINLLIDTIVASYFIGGITVINFANDIQTLPTVVFAISIATAVFPSLAELTSKGDKAAFIKTYSEAARKVLYFMVPATIGIFVLRAQIVRLVFGTGNFSWEDTYWTTKALGFFALGLIAQGLVPITIRAFYALKDTKTPLLVSIAVMITNVVFSVTLPFIPNFGLEIAGVALAYSIASFVNIFLLLYFLNVKLGAFDKDNRIFSSFSRLIVASTIMGIVVHYSLYFFDIFVDTHMVMGLFAQTTGAIALGGIIYLGVTHFLKVEEAGNVFKKIF